MGNWHDVREYFHDSNAIFKVYEFYKEFGKKDTSQEKNVVWLLSEMLRFDPSPQDKNQLRAYLKVFSKTLF